MMEWHRLFGLALKDFFTDSAYHVELEKDLSLKQQFLDVVIIEQETGQMVPEPPDGLENLARHNLLTYKSIRQSLDGWALDELIEHYVNYRKQISRSGKKLLPVEDFRLYAVSTRAPEKLAPDQVEGITMPYTWNDFYREFTKEHLDLLPAEERLKGLPAEDRLKGLPAEALLQRLSAKEIEAYLKKLRQKKRKRK
jgi:hypothetical protein